MKFFDSHTHLQFAAYNNDRKEVLQRALNAGVYMINVGTQKETSQAAVELSENYDSLFAVVGIHPSHTYSSFHDKQELVSTEKSETKEETLDFDYYKKLASHKKVVAVGECGLDYFRINETKNQEIIKTKQKEVFREHIELAKEVGKPLMIHCRPSFAKASEGKPNSKSEDAYEDLYNILKPETGKIAGAVIHFFVGTPDTAKKFLDLGFYFTFGGVITFARDYDETIKLIPLEKILLETDAPYVTPAPHRGKRNEPSYVVEVYKKMAELKDIPLEELTEKILENNERVFGISPRNTN